MSKDDAQTHEWIVDMGAGYDLRVRITTTGHAIEVLQEGHLDGGKWGGKVICGVSGGNAHFRTLVREWDTVLRLTESRVADAAERAREATNEHEG